MYLSVTLKALASGIVLFLYKLCLKGVKGKTSARKEAQFLLHEDADDLLKKHVSKLTKMLSISNSNTHMTFCVHYFCLCFVLDKTGIPQIISHLQSIYLYRCAFYQIGEHLVPMFTHIYNYRVLARYVSLVLND